MLMFGSLSCDLRNSLDPHSRGVDRVNANTQIGAQKDREVVLGFNAANTNGMLRGSDIDRLNAPFLAVFKSLVPAEEEKAKQKQLLTSLEKLVNKEWPSALMYLYGSCANSFGVSKSDIDVCLAIEETDITKSEILLKLAELLESDNLENVQEMETTYAVTVDGIECVFFDKVENLRDFGARNKENRATCVGIL